MNSKLLYAFLWTFSASRLFALPTITQQPSPATNSVSLGAILANRVVATSAAPPLRFQWRRDGADLPGQTNATLSLTNIRVADAGAYTALATDASGSIESKPWVVQVDPAFMKITAGPVVNAVNGSAAAWGDYDGDGWVDLYVTTFTGPSYLFRNDGNGGFTSVTGVPIVAGGINSFGCVWGDYDNDGFLDLLQGGYNLPSRLFRNNGNGSFTQVTTGAIASVDRGANNVLWADYDNDGFIDLFAAISFNAPLNVLYHNNGGGTFTKITNTVVTTAGSSQGASWGDYDNDGFVDLLVDRTGATSLLYHNERNGEFTRVTNTAVTAVGSEIHGGASWSDYDNDRFLDLFVSSYGSRSALYHNNGDGTFARITNSPVYQSIAKSTGGAWADYDNDGWLDLFVANDSEASSFLYHNDGDGTFTRVTTGSLVNEPSTGQGAAWGDYDNDGFADLIVPNIRNHGSYLYRNNGNSNAWLTVKLEGRLSNRAGIGAKVRLRANIAGNEIWQLREISGGGSLGSQNDLRAAFGLGDATNVELVRVEWPSGIVQEFHDILPRQFLTIIEPEASIAPAAQEVQAGATATFTASTTLPPPVNFQWRLNGIELPGETNTTLVITNAQGRDAGKYTVAVKKPDAGLTFNSPAALLTGPVVITQQPRSLNVRPGSNALFSVVASGISPIAYQWRFNSANLSNETNATLLVTNAQLDAGGSYDVVVANSYGPVMSTPVTLGILIKPAITVQPLGQSVVVGGSVTLSVAVTGSPAPFTFEWRSNSIGLWTNITSEPMSFMTLTNLQTNQAGNYRVVIKNAANSQPGIISSNAVLTVLPDSDGDGLPDDWEIVHGLNSANASDGELDADGDGSTNHREYLAGTDPQDALNFLRLDGIDWNLHTGVSLHFAAMSNKTYTVQSCSSVTGGPWGRIADVPAAPTNRTVMVNDPVKETPEQRFYRLTTSRVP